ncbi:MAG TPA: LptE family protein [Flavisolibacter sp.]|jgi:hypothetical protein|nr:LptE family protein [Flavisolibacter sp.]
MKKTTIILFLFSVIISGFAFTGCGIYSFSPKGTLPDSIKTVRVQIFENRAPYVNPQLTPNLTDRVRQKITRQTKLTQTNGDANLDISGTITDYSVLTTGVSSANGQKQTSVNRLTVTVHVIFNNTMANDSKETDVSLSFDFSANQSLQQAEAQLLDEMVRQLSDEIFNRIFSDW